MGRVENSTKVSIFPGGFAAGLNFGQQRRETSPPFAWAGTPTHTGAGVAGVASGFLMLDNDIVK